VLRAEHDCRASLQRAKPPWPPADVVVVSVLSSAPDAGLAGPQEMVMPNVGAWAAPSSGSPRRVAVAATRRVGSGPERAEPEKTIERRPRCTLT